MFGYVWVCCVVVLWLCVVDVCVCDCVIVVDFLCVDVVGL